MITRPLLGHLRRALSEEARRQALARSADMVKAAPDVAKAVVRTLREDVRELPEHLRDVKAGR